MKKSKLAIVIDDDAAIRNLLGTILTSMGYETKVFNSPMDTPCIMETARNDCHFETLPELLITDIKMPEMNGIEFVVKNLQKGCEIKNIAIMSDAWTDKDKELAENLYCKQIEKPFSVSEIKEWVNF